MFILLLPLACQPDPAPTSVITETRYDTGDPRPVDSAPPDTSGDTEQQDTEPQDTEPQDTSPPPLEATIAADVTSGALPLTVQLTNAGSSTGAASIHWDFGDGDEAEGEAVSHTFLVSGDYKVTLTLTATDESTLSDSVVISVSLEGCPALGTPSSLGTAASTDITEASGLVASRDNPGVFWTHNDAGHGPDLYALGADGRHLGTWTVDVDSGDWEDLAIGRDPETGAAVLYIGDTGDNGHDNEAVWIHRVFEPPVSVDQTPVEATLSADTYTLTYPKGEPFDSETLLVDPLTGDLFLVTKDYSGPTGVFRKPAPHADRDTLELELVAEMNFSVFPLFGGSTTGGDVSPDGDWIAIRTYYASAFLWQRDPKEALWEVLDREPCVIPLASEPQGETLAFAADGGGLYTLSEGEAQPLWFIPFK